MRPFRPSKRYICIDHLPRTAGGAFLGVPKCLSRMALLWTFTPRCVTSDTLTNVCVIHSCQHSTNHRDDCVHMQSYAYMILSVYKHLYIYIYTYVGICNLTAVWCSLCCFVALVFNPLMFWQPRIDQLSEENRSLKILVQVPGWNFQEFKMALEIGPFIDDFFGLIMFNLIYLLKIVIYAKLCWITGGYVPWPRQRELSHKVDDHPVIDPLQGFPNNAGMILRDIPSLDQGT